MSIRTRFAPSPTGSLHIGGARTALYNYLLAKSHGGEFILRIEDTDKERNDSTQQQQLLQELEWLGLNWDEGPDPKTLDAIGAHGPYLQSQRSAIYHDYAAQLLQQGLAFYCFASSDEIEAQREQHSNPQAFQFQSPDREQPLAAAKKRLEAGEKAVVRFKNNFQDQVFALHDLVRGHIELHGHSIGDFVLLRADGSPVYNFCCVVDDALMQISHVLRGEEHLPNTLRQMMLYRALKFDMPAFGHLSLILGDDHKKLSKRSGASSISDFQSQGYLAPALLNYLALLGWSDPQHREILSLDAMGKVFSTDRLHAAAPMYDLQKLKWVNTQYIHALEPKQLWDKISPILSQALDLPQQPEWQLRSIEYFQQDLHTLQDAIKVYRPYESAVPLLDAHALTVLQWPSTTALLQRWIELLSPNHQQLLEQLSSNNTAITPVKSLTDAEQQQILDNQSYRCHHTDANLMTKHLSPEEYKAIVKQLQQQLNLKGKQLFMPLRIAMIGSADGPELTRVISLLSHEQLIERALFAYQLCLAMHTENG